MSTGKHKAWSGRMVAPTHALVEAFTTSFPFDRRLYAHDIAGSIAHCRMLARQQIIAEKEAAKIVKALKMIGREFAAGTFAALPSDEDVHMAIERRLIELIGAVGGKLHTARSRNDQVVLDLRLYLRDETKAIRSGIRDVRRALAQVAKRHREVVMPGYTHLQPAQPVLFAHHLLAYAEMFRRDDERFADGLRRIDVLPLGSGALAGTTFPIDRESVAQELGFREVSINSMDSVGDRDFAAEFLAAGAILGMHMSRMAEDMILWSSQEFGMIALPDAFATGSSIMPQKKNPDVAELIRGKTGRLYGNLLALLTTLKGLPMTYNRDLQEDKEPIFDTVDTLRGSLGVLAAMLPELGVRAERMRDLSTAGFTLATELADYLSAKGIPFREAHGVVGRIVRFAIESEVGLEDLSVEQLQRFSPRFESDVHDWLSADAAVRRRRATGGTAPLNLKRQLLRAER